MQNEKKRYLNRYLIQSKKIERYERIEKRCKREENTYKKCIENSVKIRKDIEDKISNMDDELLAEILFEKYIFGKTLEEISLILNYSKRHIERLHIKALEKLEI